MQIKIYRAIICIYILVTLIAHGVLARQESDSSRHHAGNVVFGTILASKRAVPFWLRANRFGTIPLSSPILTASFSIESKYRRPIYSKEKFSKKFDWAYGISGTVNVGHNTQLLIPEAYIKARYKVFELYAGRRQLITGLVDSCLTSGSYINSGNSLPIPMVSFGTPHYIALPYTKGLIAFHATYGHGWFKDGRVENFYLHQKQLYFKIGKPYWKIKFFGGLNHQTQWGGFSKYLIGSSVTKDGHLPRNLKSYYNMVIARRMSDRDVSTSYVDWNRIGNHLGTADLGMTIDSRKFSLLLYRQNIYDDGSLLHLNNIKDGLNGLSIMINSDKNNFFKINRLLVEYLYTENQGGKLDYTHGLKNPKLRGQDNYFENIQYVDGWTYESKTIGTPFITPVPEVRTTLPRPDTSLISNSRLALIHIGLFAKLARKMDLILKMSYSNNRGTYRFPYGSVRNQFSCLIETNIPLQLPIIRQAVLNCRIGLDRGALLASSTGFYFGIRKDFGYRTDIKNGK